MIPTKDKIQTMDEYISTFAENIQNILVGMRRTIKEAAPEAEEAISYQIPTFKLHRNLVHFAAFKNHIGFYPTPAALQKFKKELAGYKSAKGSVQFPIDKPMPFSLIKEIVRYRVKENLEKKIEPNKSQIRKGAVMSKMNPVVHFEMPAEDKKRMAEFYSKVFGWQTQFFGPEMGEYVVVSTTETDDDGRPRNPGAINGGFYLKTDDPNTHHPSVVIAVDDINESIQNIKKAGGTVLGEPTEIPGIGLYVSFKDTEGNRASVLQPIGMLES